MNKSYGFSLSEVLIALLISGFLSSAMLQLYLSVKKHYQWYQLQLEDFQEKVLIMKWMKSDLISAGLRGCHHYQKNGFEILDASSPILPTHIAKTAVPGNQILKIFQIEEIYAIEHFQLGSQVINLKKAFVNSKKTKIIIYDCIKLEEHSIKRISKNKQEVILNKTINKDYKTPILAVVKEQFFYIRQTITGNALYLSNGRRSQEVSHIINELRVKVIRTAPGVQLLEILFKLRESKEFSFYVAVLGKQL